MSEDRITLAMHGRLPGGYGESPINEREAQRWAREKESSAQQYVNSSLTALEQGIIETRDRVLDEAPQAEGELSRLVREGNDRALSADEYRERHEDLRRQVAILAAQGDNLTGRIATFEQHAKDPSTYLNHLRGRYPQLQLPQVEIRPMVGERVERVRRGTASGADALRAAKAAVRRSEDVLLELEERERRLARGSGEDAALRAKYSAIGR